jgi:uncharacterized protein Yka (UPF0111/DUF47 family)
MLGWFRALMPREERFFELFKRHAHVTLSGAEALRALLRDGGDVTRCCDEVNAREEEADAITRDVLTALRRSFITPLDRGDIKDLITSMDDAIDQMNKTVKVIRLFEFRNFAPCMQEMGELIVRAAKVNVEAVPLLRSIGKEAGRLNALTEEMIRIEGSFDELHDKGRRDLFLAETNAIAFMIGSEVYDSRKRDQRYRHRERLTLGVANGRCTGFPWLPRSPSRSFSMRSMVCVTRRTRSRPSSRPGCLGHSGMGGILQLHRRPALTFPGVAR